MGLCQHLDLGVLGLPTWQESLLFISPRYLAYEWTPIPQWGQAGLRHPKKPGQDAQVQVGSLALSGPRGCDTPDPATLCNDTLLGAAAFKPRKSVPPRMPTEFCAHLWAAEERILAPQQGRTHMHTCSYMLTHSHVHTHVLARSNA